MADGVLAPKCGTESLIISVFVWFPHFNKKKWVISFNGLNTLDSSGSIDRVFKVPARKFLPDILKPMSLN